MDIKNPTAAAYVATLPRETLLSAKQAKTSCKVV